MNMDQSSSMRLLTQEEATMWEESGLVVVRNAIDAGAARSLASVVHDVSRQAAATDSPLRGYAGNPLDINLVDAHCAIAELLPLVDLSAAFRVLLGIMGPRIQVAGIETLCRYASHRTNLPIHTDGGASLRNILLAGLPIQVKMQVFLTDTTAPGAGAFCYVSGSHRRCLGPEQLPFAAEQAVYLPLAAGDAVIFPWSLWHGAAHKQTEPVRVSAIVRYSQLWARQAFSSMQRHQSLCRETLTARQRLLLYPEECNPHGSGEHYYKRDDVHLLSMMYGSEGAGSRDMEQCFAGLAQGISLYTSL